MHTGETSQSPLYDSCMGSTNTRGNQQSPAITQSQSICLATRSYTGLMVPVEKTGCWIM